MELQAHDSDLRALDVQIKSTEKSLESFKPLLSRLGPANAGTGMLLQFGKVVSGVISVAYYVRTLSDFEQLNSAAQTVVNCIDVAYKVGHFFALSE